MSEPRNDLDRQLRAAFAAAPKPILSPTFHARLERRLEAEAPRRRRRFRARLLASYWAAAFGASLFVLSTLPTGSDASALPVQIAFLLLLAVFASPALLLRRWLWPEVVVAAIEALDSPR